MNKYFIVGWLVSFLILGGCARDVDRPLEHIPQASDSLYTARAAMLTYGTDPERALVIIDSARIVGNIDDFEADFLRAKVYTHSPDNPHLDEAVAICKDLLKRDSTGLASASANIDRSSILQLLMDSYRMRKDYEPWLKYAIELADLNRQEGAETEALRMEAEIGLVMTHIGRHDEGLAKLDRVINALDAGPLSVDRMDAGIVARKRKIIVFEEDGNYDAVIPEGQAIIKKLEDYEKHPSAYAEDSFRLPPIGADRARYCNYYKAQARAFIARAYAQTTPPDFAEARKYVKLLEQSDYGKTFGGRVMIAPAWKALGEWNKLLATYEEIEARMGADTLNYDYATILKNRADVATAQGRPEEALDYMNRYSKIQDELSRKAQESEAQEYAAKYHAQEQDRKIKDAEEESSRKDVIIIAIIFFALVAAVFTWFLSRRRYKIREQAESQKESQASIPEPKPELFQMIDGTIRREKLYLNDSLQRQDILDRFDISRRTLNDLLAAHADGQSFTAYINSMRLADAVRLLHEEPRMSLTEIAESVGFTPATFRDQFKRHFGMTPTEYRQNL